MAKFKHPQREELKQCVRECLIRRLTTKEIQRYIKQKLDFDLSYDYLLHLRADLKKDSEKELNLYQKDRFAFLDCIFFDRIRELHFMQKTLHEIIENEEDSEVKIKAVNQLQIITTQLFSYYCKVPQVARVGAADASLLFPIPTPTSDPVPASAVIEDRDGSYFCEYCNKRHLHDSECGQNIF